MLKNQVLSVIGDDVMNHVACRVTVDGTLPEASPVEATLIQIVTTIRTMEHAHTREAQATCNLGLGKLNQSVEQAFIEKLKGLHCLHFQ